MELYNNISRAFPPSHLKDLELAFVDTNLMYQKVYLHHHIHKEEKHQQPHTEHHTKRAAAEEDERDLKELSTLYIKFLEDASRMCREKWYHLSDILFHIRYLEIVTTNYNTNK